MEGEVEEEHAIKPTCDPPSHARLIFFRILQISKYFSIYCVLAPFTVRIVDSAK